MATSNRDRVGSALDLLREGLAPFVARHLADAKKRDMPLPTLDAPAEDKLVKNTPAAEWDAALLLKVMQVFWREAFQVTLGNADRSLVQEMRDHRNKWAHQKPFNDEDTHRALDTAERLLTAVSAEQARELGRVRKELLRVRVAKDMRKEELRSVELPIESRAKVALPPWREVVSPHPDVAEGHYRQAEFAADLWQVHSGEGAGEYKNPVEFFRRTFLTESLTQLLTGAVRRLTTGDGDPVIQLQTNFGGGKTHSMLALFHLFSGAKPSELPDMESIVKAAGAKKLPDVRRVVLVGTRISPGNPSRKEDGTEVRTLWGELAWQLGGREAYERVRNDDEKATNPAGALQGLLDDHGPCLILIDEWVAYARQLRSSDNGNGSSDRLPGGDFETHFTFAQALTDSAKAAKNCLLVVSLPVSHDPSHAEADDAEVGGSRGRDALDRLHNVIGRVESSWRPASAEESFEIVRRRLFEPLGEDSVAARDEVAKAYAKLYRAQKQEFPLECQQPDYQERIKIAYPVHPEIFDLLYSEWSALLKFQRTRGVLRLMAAVIHSLWEKGDQNPLIQPASIPMDDERVRSELTRYLSDNWTPIIEKDVDGPHSLPLRLDNATPNFGKSSACRRVARTIYLGSAPGPGKSNQGIEVRRVKLGCVMPGESVAVFGDALRHLAGAATYLYQDNSRYWYSTQPTVAKLAEDRAEQLRDERDKISAELEKRLRAGLRNQGGFAKIHALPQSGHDVPDEHDTRLVVLGTAHPHSRDAGSAAVAEAKKILESRGGASRLYRNTLVFLAADKTRLQDLEDAVRRFLAWESILAEKNDLNLTQHQIRQAETLGKSADTDVNARLPEIYRWLLAPKHAKSGDTAAEWQELRLSGQEPLAARAAQKLAADELLIASLAGTSLRLHLDDIPLWETGKNHIAVRLLAEHFARYLYLPRLRSAAVLLEAVQRGLTNPQWNETFAYAEKYDEAEAKYLGLRCGPDENSATILSPDGDAGMLVKPDAAQKQRDAEKPPAPAAGTVTVPPGGTTQPPGGIRQPDDKQPPAPAPLKRFHGAVTLDAARVGLDASNIAKEVIAHLTGLPKADVTVTLEIHAEIDGGVPDNTHRTVTENCRTLKFTRHGFDKD